MKKLLYPLLIILLIESLLPRCANPKNPTGGPKDTIPPVLLNTIPPFGALNFDGQEIELQFNERVTAEKIQSNLIITPQLDIKYKTLLRKNSFIIRFEEDFPDTTTITLSFFNGITDVTEKNPAENLKYVFSTGDYLDSMAIAGMVKNLMSNKPASKYLIGLYALTDTLDFFKTKPTYFTTTDEEGLFSLGNIKIGKYRLIAFHDANSNLLLEGSSEPHAFIPDTLQLDSAITGLSLFTQNNNSVDLEILSARSIGQYFDVRYSKGINNIKTDLSLHYNFLPETNTIRFYQSQNFHLNDSLFTILEVSDSIYTTRSDTVYVKFSDTQRKPLSLEYQLLPESKNIDPIQEYSIHFNKPINTLDTSRIFFKRDSLFTVPIDTTFSFNENNTVFKLTQRIDTTNYYERIAQIQAELDSIAQDTTAVPSDSALTETKAASRAPTIKKSIELAIMKGAFISIENDTIPEIIKELNFDTNRDHGLINLSITTDHQSYILQFIDSQYHVLYEYINPQDLSFSLPAGNYGVRVLIDNDGDGIWFPGNLLLNLPPEEVFVHDEFTDLRTNWHINLAIQF